MSFADEFAKFRKPMEIARAALRAELEERLAELTESQRAHFKKFWPSAPPAMSFDALKNAVDVCQRTVAKNRAGRPAPT